MNATGSQGCSSPDHPRTRVSSFEPRSLWIVDAAPRAPRPEISASAPGWAAEAVKPSTISTAQLHRLPGFHMPPIEQVISLRSYPVDPVGNLILRRASHLDAFSAYPNRT